MYQELAIRNTRSDGKKGGQWSVVSGQLTWKRFVILLTDPERMKRISEEAKKWSQQYTLERFEGAIKKVLLHPNEEINVSKGKLSPAPFREGVKRGKSEE